MEIAKEIELISADWDRSYYNACSPHHPMVGEGVIQCCHCLALFIGKDGKKQAKLCLKENYGETYLNIWKEMKDVLKKVNVGKIKNLREYVYLYRDKNGIIVNDRRFYEKIPRTN